MQGNGPFGGGRCWLDDRKVYAPQDPLEGWQWLNGSQYNGAHRWGLDGILRYTHGDEERCAVINLEHEIWEEKDCTLRRHFICKKKVCKLLKYIVAVEDTQRPYTFNRGKKGNETPPSEKSQTIEL